MCPDELHEGDLPTEIESSNQAIVSSRDLEPHTLAVQHLGFRSGFLDLIRGTPLRRSHELVPAFKRDLRTGATISESDFRAEALRRCDSVVGDRRLRRCALPA